MADTPKVSLLMTAYNSGKYIAEAIESALSQTMSDFELIIRDDSSTDNTLEIIHQYAGKDPRIVVIEGDHVGMALGYNETIERAAGQYIGFLDSDDLISPITLESACAVMDEDPDAALVYTDYYDMSEDGSRVKYGNRCKIPYSPKRLLVDLMVFHFRFFRRSTFDRIGVFHSDMEMAFDYDLILRISEKLKIVHLPRPLYRYRNHSNSVSYSRTYEQIEASKRAVEKALERRGMADEYELQVQILSKFRIRKK